MGYVNKSNWPSDQRGFGIGRLSYLIGIFENKKGSYYVEFDTACDVTLNYARAAVETNCWRFDDLYKQPLCDVQYGMKESIMGRSEMSISAELLFDLYDSASVGLMNNTLYGNYFRVGAFTDMGFGPWFWTFATKIDRSEPLSDIVKINVELPCARFITWYDSCYEISNGVPSKLIKSHPLVFGGIVTKLPQTETITQSKKKTFSGTSANQTF